MPKAVCAVCAKPIELAKTSRPAGEAMCRPCWKVWSSTRITHGYGGYTRGCRCDACTTGRREYERLRRSRQAIPRPEVECGFCGKLFTASNHGARYCSSDCQRLLKNQKQMAKYREAHARTIPCLVCSLPFDAYGPATICSDTCRRKRASQYTLDRKAKVRDAFVANVDRQAIFRRDRWRCYRCGCQLMKVAPIPHPRAATLDHLVPISRGGTHEPANVKACCYLCNCSKGNRGGNEQLLLIG